MDSNSINKQWLDTLRALAMLGVIIIHVSSPLVKMTYGKNMSFWWIGNIADSAVRYAVPLFLMLSGATLLVKEYKLGEYYKRRFLRVLVPFLFWMMAYWVYRWWTLIPKNQPHELHAILQWATNLFLNEGISKHFWYIYMIVFIYLFVPFMGKGLRKLSSNRILYLLVCWIIITFALKSVPLNMYNWSGGYAAKLLGYFLYSGYLILGYYLGTLTYNSNWLRRLALTVFVISIVAASAATYYLSNIAHKLDLSMYGYLSVNTILQSAAIFLWFKDTGIKNKYLSKIQFTVSNYSYGIYLVHIMVIGIFFNNGIFWTMMHPLLSIPLITAMTLVASFIIIYILRKIPFGNYISG